MLEVLQFVFQSFWHWAGTLCLITAIGSAVAEIVGAIRRPHHTTERRAQES